MMKNKPLAKHGLTIGDVADRTGLAPSAIRFYEEEGLVFPDRNAGGQRRFDRSDIRRLSFVMISQSLGFSLPDIKDAFKSLPEGRTPTKRDWERISARFRRDLDARIAKMQTLREKLDGCIGCGCLSLQTCKLYNAEDRAHRKGQGPRYLMGDSVD